MSRELKFTREDGSQVLVVLNHGEVPHVAERKAEHWTWGPPIPCTFDSLEGRGYRKAVDA